MSSTSRPANEPGSRSSFRPGATPVQEPLHGGNLLVAGGFLFVVTNDKLFALDQQSGMRLNANKPEQKQP